MSVWTKRLESLVEKIERKPVRVLILIVMVALAVRVLYVLIAPQVDPVLRRNPLHGDASGYHLLAQNMLDGKGFSWDGETPTSYRVPGYPLFLAGVYLLFGESTAAVGLVQALLGALLCAAVFFFARRSFGVPMALLGAAVVALHPLLIYMTAWVYAETLFLLLLWTALWLWVSAQDRPLAAPQLITSGLLLGLSTLVRPEVVIFMPMLLGTMFLLRRWQEFRRALVVLAVSLLVLVPWAIRNQSVHNAFVPLTTSAGSNFYAGNNPESNGGSAWAFPLEGMSEVASDQALRAQSVRWMQENPGEALQLLPKKLYRFLSPAALETSGSPFGRFTIVLDLIYAVFLFVAVLGVRRSWRTPAGLPAALLTAVYVLTALVFYGGTRVSMPVIPALVMFAVAGIPALVDQRIPATARAPQL